MMTINNPNFKAWSDPANPYIVVSLSDPYFLTSNLSQFFILTLQGTTMRANPSLMNNGDSIVHFDQNCTKTNFTTRLSTAIHELFCSLWEDTQFNAMIYHHSRPSQAMPNQIKPSRTKPSVLFHAHTTHTNTQSAMRSLLQQFQLFQLHLALSTWSGSSAWLCPVTKQLVVSSAILSLPHHPYQLQV